MKPKGGEKIPGKNSFLVLGYKKTISHVHAV